MLSAGFLYFDVANGAIQIALIMTNPYFDEIYGIIYIVILLLYIPAIIMITIALCVKESPSSRQLFSWPFLITAIANFLIAAWMIIYITTIYQYDEVKEPVRFYERWMFPDGEEVVSWSKPIYLGWMAFCTLCNAVFYLIWFIIVKMWVDMNHDREIADDALI